MNINRNNYEEFFLMYVDNELSASEREAVEAFVLQHPDLRDELGLLQSAVLIPGEEVFVPKTALLKAGEQDIQESLLLHLDNELPASAAKELEHEISKNKVVAEEWELLSRTKLAPVTIEFPDKSSLYRHEKTRVVSFNIRIVRYAVAAVFTGAALFFGMQMLNQPQAEGNGLAEVESVNVVKPGTQPETQPEVTAPLLASNEVQDSKPKNAARGNEEMNHPVVKRVVTKNNPDVALPKKEINVIPGTSVPQKESPERPLPRNQEVVPQLANNSVPAVKPPKEIIDNDMTLPKESYAMLASNEEESEDKFLYIDEEKVTRSKVGGLFRRVKRVVERNTNIKTPEGFRIGGFAIAVK